MELRVVLEATVSNPDIGDLYLDEFGREELVTEMVEEVRQRLFVRLEFFRGEWFFDTMQGTPYYEYILRKGVSDLIIRSVFLTVISGTEGVDSVPKFSYSIGRDRKLSLTFTAICVDGSTLKITDYPAFVVPDARTGAAARTTVDR